MNVNVYCGAVIAGLTAMLATFGAAAAPPLGAAQRTQIDRVAAEALAQQRVPGLTVAIARDGELLYGKGYGLRDITHGRRADAATIYEIGSITKQFTAAAVMLLVQSGKVKLDVPIQTYLSGIPLGQRITVRELLTHTSGLPNYTDQPGFFAHLHDTRVAPDKLVAVIAGKPLDFAPGTRWEYSNTNYVVLGMLIAKESGMSYPAFLRTRIFTPLALRRTFYSNTFPAVDDIAHPYDASGPTTKPVHLLNLSWAYAAGALWSDADDLVRWENALYSDRVVDAHSLSEMTTPAKLADGRSTDYGFGLLLSALYGHREIWHNGGLPGYSTRDAYFPDEHLEIAVLGDTVEFNPGPVVKGVFAALYPPTAAQLAAEMATPAPGEDAAITARARALLEQAQKDKFDRSMFTQQANAALTDQLVATVAHQLGPLGVPQRFAYTGKQQRGLFTVYTYRVTWPSASLDELVGIDKAGKVGLIFFRPVDESATPAPSASDTAVPSMQPSSTAVPAAAGSAESPPPQGQASSAAVEDAKITARARDWLTRLQKGDIDRSQLSSVMNSALTPAQVAAISKQMGPLGAPQRFVFIGSQTAGADTRYTYRVTWKEATLDELFVLDSQGEIDGLFLKPTSQ